MPINTSNLWRSFTLALIAIHLVFLLFVFLFQEPWELVKLNDIVMLSTIYLPLVPWRIAGAPVVQATIQMFPSPNVFGWVVVVLSWVLVYAIVGYFFSVFAKKLK